MGEIQIYKKPELVLLEEKLKLRDYSFDEREVQASKLVLNLLSDLGVSKNADTRHHTRSIKYISETCLSYSPEEIEKAFHLAIEGVLNVNLLQQLNSIVIGQVLREYEIYKRNKLKLYRMKQTELRDTKKELSLEQKQEIMKSACERIFDQYKEFGEIEDKADHVYNHLFELGKLPKSKLYKDDMFNKATLRAKSEAATKAGQSIVAHRKLKSVMEEITNGDKKSEIISIAKRMILEEYFKDLNELKI